MEVEGAKFQLGCILGLYRDINIINAYMLIFINELTEITKIPDTEKFQEKLISGIFPDIPDISVRNLAEETIIAQNFIDLIGFNDWLVH